MCKLLVLLLLPLRQQSTVHASPGRVQAGRVQAACIVRAACTIHAAFAGGHRAAHAGLTARAVPTAPTAAAAA
eukprot:CAMPEP_0202423254 /NCGR_PEP_ID=MMETSP1128-20130828/51283_1 /ASSEMBLY_ACC=CAM_ASM_000463 /TAXON_ID=3047 /ORGANISM="Dunaliella tertiolecta, Strain CCMP1320" /LENGTH=72 /DNA_ID=CAMNT_0049031349 /DNA_START=4654 /DNA_END=4868 /DNA_ORIENTATION=+